METVLDLPETEIIVETTGNQYGDEFNQFWCKALAGENSFLAVFLPWFDDPTYRKPVPADFAMMADESRLPRSTTSMPSKSIGVAARSRTRAISINSSVSIRRRRKRHSWPQVLTASLRMTLC